MRDFTDDPIAVCEQTLEQIVRFRPTDDQSRRMRGLNLAQVNAWRQQYRRDEMAAQLEARRKHPSSQS